MVTAVDTSVLLDVLLNDPRYAPASIAALRRAAAEGSLILCEVVIADLVFSRSAAVSFGLEVDFRAIVAIERDARRRNVPGVFAARGKT